MTRRRVGGIAATAAACGLGAWLVGVALGELAGARGETWLIARAGGVTGYLLLVLLVCSGLVMAHPQRSQLRGVRPVTRMRIHTGLAGATLTVVVLHVVLLATDDYAQVGWWGALLPMASQYRPTAVTFGVLGSYTGLATGLSAALAGRVTGRSWLAMHRFSAVALVLIWAHAVLAGTDTAGLRPMYLGTAAVVGLLAASRYLAESPQRRVRVRGTSLQRPDDVQQPLDRAGDRTVTEH